MNGATRPAAARARDTYANQDVANESPIGLIARIYQIATLEARRAATATEREDWMGKGRAVDRLLRALTLLQNSLDMESGGDIARNLDVLYAYLIRRTGDGNVRREIGAFEEVAKLLEDLGTAWGEAATRRDGKDDAEPTANANAAAAGVQASR